MEVFAMNKKRLIPKRVAMLITSSVFLIISLLFATGSLILNRSTENHNESSGENSLNTISKESSVVESSVSSMEELESSIESEQEPEEIEPNHEYVINEYGYTFVYGDSGYEQFSYGTDAFNRYVKGLNSVSSHFNDETPIYNIIAPISSTFATSSIPKDIRNQHKYSNKSQGTFVSNVGDAVEDRVNNISIIEEISERYDQGDYLFFRTDKNWTPSASYTAYTAFCENAGLIPYDISNFPAVEVGDYLGWFHFATKNQDMASNPDQFLYYSNLPSVKVALKVYGGYDVSDNVAFCDNDIDVNTAYDVFVGTTTAGRYEITTTATGGNLLIVGDSSVLPMLPFLASHYEIIDVINPMYFNKTLSELLANRTYDEVLTMCYSTSAIAGDYTPAFNSFFENKTEEVPSVNE